MGHNSGNVFVVFIVCVGVIQTLRLNGYTPEVKTADMVIHLVVDSTPKTANLGAFSESHWLQFIGSRENGAKYTATKMKRQATRSQDPEQPGITSAVNSETEESRNGDPEGDLLDRFSEHFINCEHIEIENDSFQLLHNGSVYVPMYSAIINGSDYFIKDGMLYICSDHFNTSESEIIDPLARFSEHFLSCNHTGVVGKAFTLHRNGSVYVPMFSVIFNESDYIILNGSLFICDDIFDIFYAQFSARFLNCTHTTLENGTFVQLANGSVHIPLFKMVFNKGDFYLTEGKLSVCSDVLPGIPKFESAMSHISTIGISISITFILFFMGLFLIVDTLRNLPGYCMMCLCISLLAAYFPFILAGHREGDQQCQAIGMCIMYFFLASFFWMNVLAFDVWRSLVRATYKLRLSGNKIVWQRFAMYSLYAWGLPLFVVIIGIAVNSSGNEDYRLIFDKTNCWFADKKSLGVYFAFPLVTIFCLNIVFFGLSFYMITRASLKTSENRSLLWNRFVVSLRLAVTMGLTWCFSFIAVGAQVRALFYISDLFSSLQGIFIFFGFGFGTNTRKALEKKFRNRKTVPSRSQNTITQQGQSTTSV